LLREPANAAISVNPLASLSWWPIPGAKTYHLQLGPDPGFGVPIIDRILPGTSFTTEILDSAQTFYWRVRGQNACGDASFGEVRNFETATLSNVAVSCADLPKGLPDNNGVGITCDFEVPAGFLPHDVTLDIDIAHSYRGDLRLVLTSPLGTTVRLKDISLEDNARDLIGNYDQTLSPSGPGSLSDFDGQVAGGVWKLVISDNFAQDIGQVRMARLNFSGFVPQAPPKVPIVGWLGGSLTAALAGWLCQRSARASRRRRHPRNA
jgi:subtilisin-like proprotein convertase family protein